MKKKGKIAIILGATGLTGSILLERLLTDDRYDGIKVFTRKPLGIKHKKLLEIPANLLELEKYAEDFSGDEVYCCIGTTTKKTPDKELYRKIDFGIPVACAKLCLKNNIPTILIVSAIGANPESKIFYNKTKGEMEQAVLKLEIENTFILQPSLILGPRKEQRFGEKASSGHHENIEPCHVWHF